MLVLSRRVGERIFIGKDIVITLVAVRGPTARIGIDAPREIEIVREELTQSPRGKDNTKEYLTRPPSIKT